MSQLIQKTRPCVAVIGGGLAGIAAAEAAVRSGCDVSLFEWSRVLGGKAASFFEPQTQCWVDNGQHIILGCCNELIALNQRLGLNEHFSRHDSITFTSNVGSWQMAASPYLPMHWQLAPAFLKIPFFSFRERLSTALMLRKLAKIAKDFQRNSKTKKSMFFGDWLRSEGATQDSIDKFWAPVVFSALCETVDCACLYAVAKVARNMFFSGRDAMAMFVPKEPMRNLYHHKTLAALEKLGVRVHLGARIEQLIVGEDNRIKSLMLKDGRCVSFDKFILAVPSYRAWSILESSGMSEFASQLDLGRFEPGAITSVHLWLDRPLISEPLRQTATLGNPIQWLFCPEHQTPSPNAAINGVYHLGLISASHRILSEQEMISRGNSLLLSRVMEQLKTLFPKEFPREFPKEFEEAESRASVRVLHSRVSTVFDAVFSPKPELYRNRPSQKTPFANLALAGDWTQTDWPATMEGAVISGRIAIESVQ